MDNAAQMRGDALLVLMSGGTTVNFYYNDMDGIHGRGVVLEMDLDAPDISITRDEIEVEIAPQVVQSVLKQIPPMDRWPEDGIQSSLPGHDPVTFEAQQTGERKWVGTIRAADLAPIAFNFEEFHSPEPITIIVVGVVLVGIIWQSRESCNCRAEAEKVCGERGVKKVTTKASWSLVPKFSVKCEIECHEAR